MELNTVLYARQQTVEISKPCAVPLLCGKWALSLHVHAGRQTLLSELLQPHAARSPLYPGGQAGTGPGGGASPGAGIRNMGFYQKRND